MTRNETISRIKQALKTRTGRQWSVSGGRGTAYGWITIKAVAKNAVNKYGELTEADRQLLAAVLGLARPVHHQGVSIPDSDDYYQEYIDRAEGRTPAVFGRPYWD